MRIGIDLDDVLLDFGNAFLEFHNARYSTSQKREDMNTFFMEKIWNITQEEVNQRIADFYLSEAHSKAGPVAGAIEAINILRKNHELFVVTAKPLSIKSVVDTWMLKYFPNVFKAIFFTRVDRADKNPRKKSDICKELQISVFIDDALHNAEDLAASNIRVFLLDCPWNQGELPPLVKRVHKWGEIVEQIENIKG